MDLPEPRRSRNGEVNKTVQALLDLDALVLAKWAKAYADDPKKFEEDSVVLAAKTTQPRTLQIVDGKPVFTMACVACTKVRPALPSSFKINHDKARYLDCPSGREMYNNSATTPCHECKKELNKINNAKMEFWIRCTMIYYPLRPADTTLYENSPAGWFFETWRTQGGDFTLSNASANTASLVSGSKRKRLDVVTITKKARCNICYIGMAVGGNHLANCASVNNRNVSNKGLKNHRSEDCELICGIHNVAQQHEDIKDLKVAWRQIMDSADEAETETFAANKADAVAAAERNWANSKTANGVTIRWKDDKAGYNKQCMDLDLRTICSNMASHHRQADKFVFVAGKLVLRKQQRHNTLTAQDIFELYCEQKGCCAISGGIMTIKNGVMRFSVDRINNKLGHTKANCRLVSRMFNSQASAACNFTAEMFQEMRAATKAYEV